MRILIVDDSEDTAVSFQLLLTRAGFDPIVALNGEDALALADQHQPDVILLDLALPRMDGYEVCRRLRAKHGGKMLILAVSGWARKRDRQAAMEAGCDDHLRKPVEFVKLIKRISQGRHSMVTPSPTASATSARQLERHTGHGGASRE